MTMIIIGAAITTVGALAFFLGRRFGLLALGLAAGLLLSEWWAPVFAKALTDFGINLGVANELLATIVCLLLPFIALSFTGPKVHHKREKIFVAAMLMIFTTALIAHALAGVLALDQQLAPLYKLVVPYWQHVATAGIALAIVDIAFVRGKTHSIPSRKH